MTRQKAAVAARTMAVATSMIEGAKQKNETRDHAKLMKGSGTWTAFMKMSSDELEARRELHVRAIMSWQLNSKKSFNKESKSKKVKRLFMLVLLLRE